MKIDRVGYGATLNTGNYENMKLYLEAEVESWENPIECIEVLKQKVFEIVKRKEEARAYEERADIAKNRISAFNSKLNNARFVWQNIIDSKEKAIETLKSLGIDEEKLSLINYRFPDTPNFAHVLLEEENDNEYGDDDVPLDM